MKSRSGRFKKGDVFQNNEGYYYTIEEYINPTNVIIKWNDCGTEDVVTSGNITKGAVKYLNQPSVFGVGFLGYGRFIPGSKRIREGEIRLPRHLHRYWRHILERTVGNRDITRYEGCLIHEDWLNLQNFCEWAVLQKNHDAVESNGRKWHIDKDILVKGNRTYGPDTCVFVPNEINIFFIEREVGNTGQIGVNFIKPSHPNAKDGYVARCHTGGERKYLGYFDTIEDAHAAYKEEKERAAKTLADKWEGIVDDRVIVKLHEYEVPTL